MTENPLTNKPSVQGNAGAFFARALDAHRSGRLHDAATLYEQVLALDSQHIHALTFLGTVHLQCGRHEEGLRLIGKSLAINPDQPIAHNSVGNALRDLRRLDEALASYDRALTLKPDYAEAHYNRGNVLTDLNRPAEALAGFDRAIALNPGNTGAWHNRGNVLTNLNRPAEALASFDRAIALNPGLAEAHCNRGNVLNALNRPAEALAGLDRAIALNPGYAEAHNNRGIVLQSQRSMDEALASYERAIALKPDYPYLAGSWLFCRLSCSVWDDGLNTAFTRITNAVDRGEKATEPFPLLAIPTSPAQQQRCAQILVRDRHPASVPPLWPGERQVHDRIRIGYFSSDFHNHATAHLMAELFERHDRSGFEIIGFSYGPPANDAWRQRLEKAFDRFFDVRTRTDREVAQLARELEIDIAVDLKGHTRDARIGIFALRPAPVQVNYLGFPGTLGADYMDYIVADATLIPPEHRQYYDEKIVYLPDTYQANDSTKVISGRSFNRGELGLPVGAFVFCCFNNNFKITPDLFDIWMRLLRAIPGSVLWLLESNTSVAGNLRLEAGKRGVAAERLVFAPRMELPDHLARHRQADLFLDTFYYNAHTTASDALWAGLPVVTCMGDSFAGRVAASLLNAIGLPELIARNPADYESLALDLATHPERLAAIRRKLASNRTTHPLFDTGRYTRHLEEAYRKMFERWQAGLLPDHIAVDT